MSRLKSSWQLSASSVANVLEVDPGSGLSAEEVDLRREQHGPNELVAVKRESRLQRLLKQFTDPLVSLLFAAIAISLLAWILEGAHGLPVDAIVIAVIVVANAVIGYVQEAKAADAVAALSKMTAATSTLLREGRKVRIPSSEIVPGDILLLEEGDAVGADARLLSQTGLRVQEASLTGESEAVEKDTAPIPGEPPLGDRRNLVFKGTAVVQGVGTAVVTGTGMETEMGSIATLLEGTEQDASPLKKEIARISKWLGIIVIVIAVAIMVVLVVVNDIRSASDLVQILILGVSLGVAAVPEGLPAILSLVLAIGVQLLARQNAVMKDLPSVETLGAASVICSDKTGTLTRNEMTLATVVTASGRTDFSGSGYNPRGGGISRTTSEQARSEAVQAVIAGSIANNAQLTESNGAWEIVGDPTEVAFLVAREKLDGDVRDVAGHPERLGEVPFTSERKLMSVVTADGLFTKGAPDVLLEHCTHELVGEHPRPLTDKRRADIRLAVEEVSMSGMRTLASAHRRPRAAAIDGHSALSDTSLETDLCFLGFAGIVDPPREEAKAAIARAHEAGIRTIMITGDHPVTAASIASSLSVSERSTRTLSGVELDGFDDEEFAQAARDVDVYARVSPAHKLRLVEALRQDGQIVAMTGDGVNDAPALKAADIGVAMGVTGTEVTKEASRMILSDDNYATIVAAVRQGRVVFDNIRKFLRYLLSSNMGEVCTVFFGVVLAGVIGLTPESGSGLALPLLATQILWINLVTDSGPALAMGVDPAAKNVMQRRPRGLNDHIINPAMWRRVIFIGLVMAAVTLLTIDMFLPGGLIEGEGSLEAARTAGFTTLVLAQLFNAFNARSDRDSAFIGMFTNRWLWGSIALAVVLQIAVVHIPFLQVAFGTAHLSIQQWLVALGMASIVLWVEEIDKLIRRAFRSRTT